MAQKWQNIENLREFSRILAEKRKKEAKKSLLKPGYGVGAKETVHSALLDTPCAGGPRHYGGCYYIGIAEDHNYRGMHKAVVEARQKRIAQQLALPFLKDENGVS